MLPAIGHHVVPDESPRMNTLAEAPVLVDEFVRLRETAELIARHADYPGKRAVEAAVLLEIDELHRDGHLDDMQSQCLRRLLGRAIASH